MLCLACDGKQVKGCKRCAGTGRERLTGDPETMVDAATWLLLAAERDRRDGILPVAGGMLDQTESFVNGTARVRHEIALIEASKPGR